MLRLAKKSSYKDELISEIKMLAQSNGLNTVFTTFWERIYRSVGNGLKILVHKSLQKLLLREIGRAHV